MLFIPGQFATIQPIYITFLTYSQFHLRITCPSGENHVAHNTLFDPLPRFNYHSFTPFFISINPARAVASSLFISEYIEGSSNNKAVEFYNGTGATVDRGANGYVLEYYFNGNTTALTNIALTGVLTDGDVYVVRGG
jgi:hypothetical protein